jgi:hypothetical protein
MNRDDVLRLLGDSPETVPVYAPVACLLNSGYGCVGYYNHSINEKLSDSLVLLNARLVDLRGDDAHSRRGQVSDFNDFLQDVVAEHVRGDAGKDSGQADSDNGTIPLTVLPVREIAILYPVAHIASLLKSAQRVQHGDGSGDQPIPTFLDFNNRSVVLKVLRTRLW